MIDYKFIDVMKVIIGTLIILITPLLLLNITELKGSSYVEKYGTDGQDYCCHGTGYHTGFIYKLFGIER